MTLWKRLDETPLSARVGEYRTGQCVRQPEQRLSAGRLVSIVNTTRESAGEMGVLEHPAITVVVQRLATLDHDLTCSDGGKILDEGVQTSLAGGFVMARRSRTHSVGERRCSGLPEQA